MNDVILARQLRLSIITNVFDQGLLDEEAAKELLARPLSPGNDSTIYDDSALLGDSDGLKKIADSAPEPVACCESSWQPAAQRQRRKRMSKTKIEWTNEVWNPVTGCTPVSEGCRNCYAKRIAHRLAGRYGYPKEPREFDVTLRPERLEQPLHWKKPRRVFVTSMGDLFHADVPFTFIVQVFDMMYNAPQHMYQVLTKRPYRMKAFIEAHEAWYASPIPDNIWLGTSIENQAAADERREYLEQCPAAVKFVSYEPALGPVDWTGWEFVDQIISGGESGPGARPSHPDWHRATRDFCQENEIAYFFKQFGAWRPTEPGDKIGHIFDKPFCPMSRIGKKRAGHMLDGRAWQEFPQ